MLKKQIIIQLMILSLLSSLSVNVTAVSDTDTPKGNVQSENLKINNTIFPDNYSRYSDHNIYYELDIAQSKEQFEENNMENAWNYISFGFVGDKSAELFYSSMFFITESLFKFNVMMTQLMLSVLNFGFDFNILNQMIESIEASIGDITGISSGSFSASGLFGGFASIIASLAVFYTVYLFAIKKASIESMDGLLKTVVALTAALLFFSNYSTILKGLNVITTEASGLVLSGSMTEKVKEGNDRKSFRDTMNENIWELFVERPYLLFQYGADDRTVIGEDRIENMLKSSPDSKERLELVEREVTQLNNVMMTYPKAPERFTFSWIMLIANAICSLPIFMLGLSLLLFQFWFMAIAVIAPFAFLFAALPGQFRVLQRYLGELVIPLLLKVAVSIMALFLFLMSEVVYKVDFGEEGGSGYIATLVIQFVLIGALFILRKRIMGIFDAGSKEIKALRAELGSVQEHLREQLVSRPVKATTTVTGAIAGGVIGGPQGALTGAHLGNNAGKTALGEMEIGAFAREAGKSFVLAKLQRNVTGSSGNGPIPEDSTSSSPINNTTNEGVRFPPINEEHKEDKNPSSLRGAYGNGTMEEGKSDASQGEQPKDLPPLMPLVNPKSEGEEMVLANLDSKNDAIPLKVNGGYLPDIPVDDLKYDVSSIGSNAGDDHPFAGTKSTNERVHDSINPLSNDYHRKDEEPPGIPADLENLEEVNPDHHTIMKRRE